MVRKCKPKRRVKVKQQVAKQLREMGTFAQLKGFKTPSDWPEGAVPNVRAFAPLPKGWHHAQIPTSTGNMRRCFIGPKGKLFWHKEDLERHIGKPLGDAKDVDRPRIPKPSLLQKYGADSILRRTEVQKPAAYINTRCDGLHGRTVLYAIQNYRYKREGQLTAYRSIDLKYDLEAGSLEVDKKGAKSSSKRLAKTIKPEQKTAAESSCQRRKGETVQKHTVATGSNSVPSPKKPRTSGPRSRSNTRLSSTSSASRLNSQQKDETEQKATGDGCNSPSSAPIKAELSQKVAKQTSQVPAGSKKEFYKEVFETLLLPAKTRAVSFVNAATLVGVGVKMQLDAEFLTALRDVLEQEPSTRGAAGRYVIHRFESELLKHCAED